MATYNGNNFRRITNIRHIQLCDDSDYWEGNNPILLPGEIAIVKDKRKLKLGTGARYNDTKYYAIGTEPVHIENLDNIVIVKNGWSFNPPLPTEDTVVVEDYLTIEGRYMLPRTVSFAVSIADSIVDANKNVTPVNNLHSWMRKIDGGNIISNGLFVGDLTSSNVTISAVTSGTRKPFIKMIDNPEEEGIAYRYCVKDPTTNDYKSIFSIRNNGTIADSVADKAEELNTPRKINISGAVKGGVAFDGSEDITIVTKCDGAAPKNLFIKNITITPNQFNSDGIYIINNSAIKATMVPDVYFSMDTLEYAEEAGLRVYTNDGQLVIKYTDPPEGNLVVETVIFTPTERE